MAGTIPSCVNRPPEIVMSVSMESGLDGRNNENSPEPPELEDIWSQWSPA